MSLPLAFLSDRNTWEIAQKTEVIQFMAYAVISAVLGISLVRWRRWSFYVVGPSLMLVSLLIFNRLLLASEADREWSRGFPTARYFVAGAIAIVVPVVLSGLVFLLKRNGGRTSDQSATPVKCPVSNHRPPPGVAHP